MSAAVALFLSIGLNAHADMVNKSQKKLEAEASHQLTGTVQRTYEQKETRNKFEYTHGVAEVAVEAVGKGTDIEKGDRVFVRYWKKRWIGRGNPPTDHYGHSNIPQKSDKLEIYVKGDRRSGFDALSPNGFYKSR
ncbi:hypothetical protein C5Y93_05645 [Blastopirellula marina]|uniref:Uncharacterized protein n=2 Tax=Blastopirellula marina TaxID=124 RepID=A0A2S8GRD0_9BACT|nr:hypothetical protein C5Y93_05645 [Blastopirellula marina]